MPSNNPPKCPRASGRPLSAHPASPTTHTTATQTQIHALHCFYRIGKAQTQSSHPLTSYPALSQTHLTHSTCTSSTSSAVNTKSEPHVPPMYSHPAFTATIPPPSPTSALPYQKQTWGAQTAYSGNQPHPYRQNTQSTIYLIETAHPHTTKQLTRRYNTAYSTSQTYHTQS